MTEDFKVWVQVERIPHSDEEPEDIGLPDPLGTFASLPEAQKFVRSLPGWPNDGMSDNRPTESECKRCGTHLLEDGRCTDQTCPYSDRQQHETWAEA